jgi:hypothetical protein
MLVAVPASMMKLIFPDGHDYSHWAGVGERGPWRSFGIMKDQKMM